MQSTAGLDPRELIRIQLTRYSFIFSPTEDKKERPLAKYSEVCIYLPSVFEP